MNDTKDLFSPTAGEDCDTCSRYDQCVYIGERVQEVAEFIDMPVQQLLSKPVLGIFGLSLTYSKDSKQSIVTSAPRITPNSNKSRLCFHVVIWQLSDLVCEMLHVLLNIKAFSLTGVEQDLIVTSLRVLFKSAISDFEEGSFVVDFAENVNVDGSRSGVGCGLSPSPHRVLTGTLEKQ